MNRFNEHLRALYESKERTPTPEFLAAVARLLLSRLRRAGMWNLPPRYFGYDRFNRWSDAFPLAGTDWTNFFHRLLTSSTTDDDWDRSTVVLDCFQEAVVKNLPGLIEHLSVKPNVDGMIAINIDRFLNLKQSKQDPLGSKVYQNLKAVLRRMIDDNEVSAE